MLCDRPTLPSSFAALICSLTPNLTLRQDLSQEARLRLWRQEMLHPGQDEGWYLQDLRFFLRNFLRAGRSLDSYKRASFGIPIPTEEDEEAVCDPALLVEEEIRETVGAADMQAQLQARLRPEQQPVLELLLAGFGVREIAVRLDLAASTVCEARKQIARSARQMELFSP
jgi:DNA-directed RNA polymerase specialized sigma24 family protein